MKVETLHERKIISHGMENSILEPRNGDLNIVLKVSRPLNYLSMLGRDQPAILRRELDEAQSLIAGTEVRIPRTLIISGREKRVFGIKTTPYVMGQEHIEEDKTISDVQEYLSEQRLSSLVDEYKHEPRNFISNNGVLYWIDPMKGTAGRALEDAEIMDLESYRFIRQKLSKVIRFFRL